MVTIESRLLLVKIMLAVLIIVNVIQAILHWAFTDTFMITLMGFASYQESMVKLFAVFCLLVVMLAYLAIRDPLGNRGIVISLVATMFLMSAAFAYFILYLDFPDREIMNVISLLIFSVAMTVIYPWKASRKS